MRQDTFFEKWGPDDKSNHAPFDRDLAALLAATRAEGRREGHSEGHRDGLEDAAEGARVAASLHATAERKAAGTDLGRMHGIARIALESFATEIDASIEMLASSPRETPPKERKP